MDKGRKNGSLRKIETNRQRGKQGGWLPEHNPECRNAEVVGEAEVY